MVDGANLDRCGVWTRLHILHIHIRIRIQIAISVLEVFVCTPNPPISS